MPTHYGSAVGESRARRWRLDVRGIFLLGQAGVKEGIAGSNRISCLNFIRILKIGRNLLLSILVLRLELLVLRLLSIGALVLRSRAFSTRLGISSLGLSSSALGRLLGGTALALGRE